MTCYRWDRIIHLGTTTCLLCRQKANPGALALDLTQNTFAVPQCTTLCMSCVRSPSPSTWLHQQCYTILAESYHATAEPKPTFDDVRRLADAVKPLYAPPRGAGAELQHDTAAIQEGLLSPLTRRILHGSFRQDLFAKLPVEIQAIIAELLDGDGCWYLILLGETRRLMNHLRGGSAGKGELRCREQELDLRRGLLGGGGVYVVETCYRGRSYLSRIGNLSSQASVSGQEVVLKPGTDVSRVVLSVDHIGVRRVQFVDEGAKAVEDGSPWYEILEVSPSMVKLHVTYDGPFVKHIRLPPDDLLSAKTRIWSCPEVPRYQTWNVYQTRDGGRDGWCQYVKLGPDIQGLVVCCSEFKLIGIYAFAKISTEYQAFVETMMAHRFRGALYWLYFPMSAGEQVHGAWVRTEKLGSTQYTTPALIIQTTQGRTATFGSYILTKWADLYDFTPLVKTDDGIISGIFYQRPDPDSMDISEIGVTCDNQHRHHPTEPQLHIDNYAPPTVNINNPSRQASSPLIQWYMTHARLEHLLRVRVCRHKTPAQERCLGLLLYYKDGRTECIGQFRWDYDVSRELVAPVILRSKREANGVTYVADVQEVEGCSWTGESSRSEEWQLLLEEGVVIWWIRAMGDRVVVNPDQAHHV